MHKFFGFAHSCNDLQASMPSARGVCEFITKLDLFAYVWRVHSCQYFLPCHLRSLNICRWASPPPLTRFCCHLIQIHVKRSSGFTRQFLSLTCKESAVLKERKRDVTGCQTQNLVEDLAFLTKAFSNLLFLYHQGQQAYFSNCSAFVTLRCFSQPWC